MARGYAIITENEHSLTVNYEDFGALDYEATYTLDANNKEKLWHALEAEGLSGTLKEMILQRFGFYLEKASFSLFCDSNSIKYSLNTWIS